MPDVKRSGIRMPRYADDDERKAELYDYRAALAFLLIVFVLLVGALSLIAYFCWVIVRLFRNT
jgi:hypothetical protein